MTEFLLRIECGNAAFEDPEELPRLLEKVARYVRRGDTSGRIPDSNGNRVGGYVTTTPVLATVLAAANSYAEDLASGLEDGTYDQDNPDLEPALEIIGGL